MRTEAAVRSGAEGDVSVRAAAEYQLGAVVELLGVAVGCAGDQDGTVACLHGAAGELGVGGDHSAGVDDRLCAQQLLDRVAGADGAIDQLLTVIVVGGEVAEDVSNG